MSPIEVLTLGHSVHSWQGFATLLHGAQVTAIADVRSHPFSRHTPQFSQLELKNSLRGLGIAYSFLGKELGGRPAKPFLYKDGVADYVEMAKTKEFLSGIDRVLEGTKRYRIALVCSERDPLDCHRCLLVGRHLAQRGVSVRHIMSDGYIAPNAEIEDRLLATTSLGTDDLFLPRSERLDLSYKRRSLKVAFAEASTQERPDHRETSERQN